MHLVLVHGSYLGAWSWELVTPELERLGHTVTTVELPISDRAAGGSDYADTVIAAVDWRVPAVVVGHSMGGLVVPLVASRVPVVRMIFVAGYLPRPGECVLDQHLEERIDSPFAPSTSEWTDLGEGVWSVGPATAREIFFHDAPEDIATKAIERLRPQAYRVITERTPLVEWPPVPSWYIVLRDDRIVNPTWGREAARSRLGVEAVELPGGHCPLLSRPTDLARTLAELAG